MPWGFNSVDLVIVILLLLFALEALGRPFIAEVLDFTSFLLAFFASFRYYNLPAKYFENHFNVPHGLSLAVGFITVWFLVEITFYILLHIFIQKIPKIKIPGGNVLSIIPSFLRGLIFIALTLVLFATFPIHPAIKKEILDSKIGSYILNNAYALEQPVKNVFGGVANDTLTFLTIHPKTDEKVDLGFTTTNFKIDPENEGAMVDLVNSERRKLGLSALSYDEKLTTIARNHSADMLKRGYFSHYSPEGETVVDRARKTGINYQVIGENLAYAPTLELAHKGLMNSPGHRANILSADYRKIGGGIMDGGIYGKMFTQVFSD